MAHILVVDDDKTMRLLLRAMLESRGHSVVEAENGAEGLRYYRVAPTDLVITDIEMPVKNGLQMMQELRNMYPTARIIAISGDRGRLAEAQTLSQCTFEKPLYLEEFLNAVQECAATSADSLYMLQLRTLAAVHSLQGDA